MPTVQQNSLNAPFVKKPGAAGTVLMSNGVNSIPTWNPSINWQPITENTLLVPGNGYTVTSGQVILLTLPTNPNIGDIYYITTVNSHYTINLATHQYLLWNGINHVNTLATTSLGATIAIRCTLLQSPAIQFSTMFTSPGTTFTGS